MRNRIGKRVLIRYTRAPLGVVKRSAYTPFVKLSDRKSGVPIPVRNMFRSETRDKMLAFTTV